MQLPSKQLKADHRWRASETPFKWRFAAEPMVARNSVLAENHDLSKYWP